MDRFLIKKRKSDQEEEPETKKLKTTSEDEAVAVTKKKFDMEVTFKKIKKEKLNLSYVRLFEKSEADAIFKALEDTLEYFDGDLTKVQVFGKWHPIPRKQVSHGDTGLAYKYSGVTIHAKPWTPLLKELRDVVGKICGVHYNFVLVNRYKDGDDKMGEHKDDEKELDASVPIASLSFGQARDFVLRHQDRKKGVVLAEEKSTMNILLEHGSLLLMEPPTNSFWYHSLPPRKSAKHPRINLTFRRMKMSAA